MPLVFAYGSLAGLPGRPATLRGFRRVWGVAMDNRVAIPGYKRYLDPVTREPPPVHVAFVDLEPDRSAAVEGVLLDVDAPALAALDDRERNYERVGVELDGGTRAFTYLGSADGRARLREGRAAGTAVIARSYLDAVSLPPDLPVADLLRVEL